MQNAELKNEVKKQAKLSIKLFREQVVQNSVDLDDWHQEFLRQRRLLDRAGVEPTDAVMAELDELISIKEVDEREVVHRATELLAGRDSMLIDIDELESLASEAASATTSAYLAGVAYARRSMQAAGIAGAA